MNYPETIAGPYEAPPRSFTDKEGKDIAVRTYGEGPVEDEYEALVEMYVAFDPADRAQGIPPTGEERIRDWLDAILGADCHNLVAWHDEAAIGHATLVPDRDDTYELAIFVRHAYQNAGIGTQLMEALLGLGREAGVERVWLTVERWNKPAINLYEKVGFRAGDTGSFELEMGARLRESGEDDTDESEA